MAESKDQFYPKWKYSRNQPPKMVHSEGEEDGLGEGWHDSPAVEDPVKDLVANVTAPKRAGRPPKKSLGINE